MLTKRLAQTAFIFLLGALLVALSRVAGLPQVAQATANTWSTTGSMASARREHTATLLPDGTVLVAGGWDGSSVFNSAELYNPASGAFVPTGNLNTARYGHTATLLPNGLVLVAGGAGSGGLVPNAELYDPASGQWSTVDMNDYHFHHTATLLLDGRVLVAGGQSGNSAIASAELYDPAASPVGDFNSTGNLNTARYSHTATLLPDGRVLAAGGQSGSSSYEASGELYDPATGGWSPAGGSMSNSRAMHTATLLPDGAVLVAGGKNASGTLDSADLYTPGPYPAPGSWSSTGALGAARREHTAALLPDGCVLVAGGYGSGGNLASTQVYSPTAGAWSDAAVLNTARGYHTATLLPGGRLLVTGGENGGNTLASAELYDPAAGVFIPTDNLNAARHAHTATLLPDGRVLLAGGVTGTVVLTSTELYDPATDTFTSTGALKTARYEHSATLLPDGRVLAAGGWGSNGPITSTELYDPARSIWSLTSALHVARSEHTATLLPDGRVLVAGGWTGGDALASAELYDPATGAWSQVSSLNTARFRHSATLLPDGRVLMAGGTNASVALASAELYYPADGIFISTGNLNAARDNHTATLLPDSRVLVAGGWGGGPLSSAELYDPVAGSFASTGNLNTARVWHSATLLPDGRVLVAGGDAATAGGVLTSTELYDPAARIFTPIASLNIARYIHTATLLPDGRVLVAGGYNSSGHLTSTELYTHPLGWRPALDSVTTPLALGNRLSARGSGWRGYNYAEASGGGTTSNSATNYPLVQLRRLDNEQVKWLLPDPAQPFTATEFTSRPVTDLPPGQAIATVFVNGVPSLSKIILVRPDRAPVAMADPERILFSDGFENGVSCTMDGLWHLEAEADTCGSQHTPFPSPNHAIYYGLANTCNYSTGLRTTGALALSTPVDIQGMGWATLSFWSYEQTEGGGYFDKPYVELFTGSGLNAARGQHSATPLPDGRVLVAGGYSSGSHLTSTELYDPATSVFTFTGNLNTARSNHTATPLPDGHVLLAGGWGYGGLLTSTELYDPATSVFTFTGNLNTARYYHTATPLTDGRVLVAGGYSSGIISSTELYNPATGIFTFTGNLNIARYEQTATPLPDGRVLVAGGYGSNGVISSTELYNPATGIFTSTGSLNIARYGHTATPLPNGRVLLAGGQSCDSYYCFTLASAELYDPAVGVFTFTGSLNATHYDHTATPLPDGRVLVAGGRWCGWGDCIPLASAELYDPATGVFTPTGSLNTARYAHTATLLPDGHILVAGGYTCEGWECFPLSSVELYDPASGAWTLKGWNKLGQMGNENQWHKAAFDLTPYMGNTAQIRFRFDSLDSYANDYFGWMVDEVEIRAGSVYTTLEDVPLSVALPGVLGNDTDPDNDPLAVALGAGPAHGLLSLNIDGSFVYTPSLHYYGPDSFSYIASDSMLTGTAIVNLSVQAVNDSPVAASDSYTTTEDTPLSVAAPGVLDNDNDPDNDPLAARLGTSPTHGQLSLNVDGSFVYTPSLHYYGPDSFTYIASDGMLTGTTAVNLTIQSVNAPPLAAGDSYTTTEDTPLNVAAPGVLGNDSDPDNDPLTASLGTSPTHGLLSLHQDGAFIYTPSFNYHGTDSFTYIASDGLVTDTAVVNLRIITTNYMVYLPIVLRQSP